MPRGEKRRRFYRFLPTGNELRYREVRVRFEFQDVIIFDNRSGLWGMASNGGGRDVEMVDSKILRNSRMN